MLHHRDCEVRSTDQTNLISPNGTRSEVFLTHETITQLQFSKLLASYKRLRDFQFSSLDNWVSFLSTQDT